MDHRKCDNSVCFFKVKPDEQVNVTDSKVASKDNNSIETAPEEPVVTVPAKMEIDDNEVAAESTNNADEVLENASSGVENDNFDGNNQNVNTKKNEELSEATNEVIKIVEKPTIVEPVVKATPAANLLPVIELTPPVVDEPSTVVEEVSQLVESASPEVEKVPEVIDEVVSTNVSTDETPSSIQTEDTAPIVVEEAHVPELAVPVAVPEQISAPKTEAEPLAQLELMSVDKSENEIVNKNGDSAPDAVSLHVDQKSIPELDGSTKLNIVKSKLNDRNSS